jgi:hypothetical protein
MANQQLARQRFFTAMDLPPRSAWHDSAESWAASQSLFSFESIQRFRAARNAEQAAQLTYSDTLDAHKASHPIPICELSCADMRGP